MGNITNIIVATKNDVLLMKERRASVFNRKFMKEKRREQHLTQTELAKMAGISQTYYCNFERGKYTPTLRRMEAIAKALGCSVKDLILEE